MTLLLALLTSLIASAAPPQPSVSSGTEPGVALRAFGTHEDMSFMAEGLARNETGDREVRAITLGAYYQPLTNLEVGAFYQRAAGLRHDDDWAHVNNWEWNNTNSRWEDIFFLDVSPRFLLADRWVAELKSRYFMNTFNGQQTYMLRPRLTYFLLHDDKPFWNFFLEYELDFPVNYGAASVYEKWIYLGALYRLGKDVDIGGFAALKWQTWGTSRAWKDRDFAPYRTTTQTTVINALLIYHFDI